MHVRLSQIDVTLEHNLGRAEAVRRFKLRARQAEQRGVISFIPSQTMWNDAGCVFCVTALGYPFRGRLHATDSRAELSVEVALPARALSTHFRSILTEEGRRLLERTDDRNHQPAQAPPNRRQLDKPDRPAGAADAVIGVIAHYGWDEISVWVNSLAETGFLGDRIVIAIDVNASVIGKLERCGCKVVTPRSEERLRDELGVLPILVERFHFIAKLLENVSYRFVILTDVRDLAFQRNPSSWLEDHAADRSLIASSEGLRLGDEWWGRHMLTTAFGKQAYRAIRKNESFNAGVIAGSAAMCRDICQEIVSLCVNRQIRNADQAAYNLLLHSRSWNGELRTVRHDEAWACQAGTVADPVQLPSFLPRLRDVHPSFDGAVVRAPNGEPYAIVHQYDRVPPWRTCFERRFR